MKRASRDDKNRALISKALLLLKAQRVAFNYMLKRAAERAGITGAVSPHWLRHAHGSHALDRGATLAEVQTTLGHANVATTSGYLHARPDTSSGLKLDPGIFR